MKGMIKIDVSRWVQSPQWLSWFLISVAVCLLTYVTNAIVSEVNPGNGWGIVYGTVASLVMVGVVLYAVRRRMLNRDLGNSNVWVQFHLYGGTLFLLLMFMHCGFHLPSGAMNWWLWGLSVWVTLSGFLGLAIQKWIPRILTSGLAVEAMYERVPDLVMQIRDRAEKLIETCTDPIKDLYRKAVAPALAMPQPRMIYYFDITGGIQSRMQQIEYLKQFLSVEERESLDLLKAMFKTKLELDAHYTLQMALRLWLYTHVPLSLVLLLLVGLHLWAVLYY